MHTCCCNVVKPVKLALGVTDCGLNCIKGYASSLGNKPQRKSGWLSELDDDIVNTT